MISDVSAHLKRVATSSGDRPATGCFLVGSVFQQVPDVFRHDSGAYWSELRL